MDKEEIMKIQFIKDFAGCNFKAMHGTEYKKGAIVTLKENNVGFVASEHIDIIMGAIALDNGYANKIKEVEREKVVKEYETKVIKPEIKVIKAENKQETEKEKKARKMREYRAKKRK